ncbi:hypothetical protein NW752_006034 [Fusarium irregulare]|uniref:CFEM domain-containing protein n=1 Tax=Fusarium irregulare TaxID=2494466 RepID=A0A9W8U882_9HYPO|nr:hypothetical protein NW766_006572 [Fusarium irregulare]KAJ4016960.1 hypothetical protein NW752_006034 [Fusarium irregulare]
MANKNAKHLAEVIPQCVAGCFDIGVAATGCDDDDYDCWCYKANHQTVVDTVEVCLINQKRRTQKECTDDEMFQYENSYWKICEQYWEPTGTATEPTSYPTAPATSLASTKSTDATTATSLAAEETATEISSWTTAIATQSGDSEAAEATGPSETESTSGGLSSGGKAGVGVGVALGVILLGVAIFLWLRERRKRRNIEEKLRVAEVEKAEAVQTGGYGPHVMYEMEGDRPHAEELRGSMRTPELGAERKSDSVTEVAPVSPSDNDKDSTFSSRSYEWPISPESPNRDGAGNAGSLGEVKDNNTPKPPAP